MRRATGAEGGSVNGHRIFWRRCNQIPAKPAVGLVPWLHRSRISSRPLRQGLGDEGFIEGRNVSIA